MEAQRINNLPKVTVLEGGRDGIGSQVPQFAPKQTPWGEWGDSKRCSDPDQRLTLEPVKTADAGCGSGQQYFFIHLF